MNPGNQKISAPHFYKSNGRSISKNLQHNFWIITIDATGRWWNINCSDEYILQHYPIDVEEKPKTNGKTKKS